MLITNLLQLWQHYSSIGIDIVLFNSVLVLVIVVLTEYKSVMVLLNQSWSWYFSQVLSKTQF